MSTMPSPSSPPVRGALKLLALGALGLLLLIPLSMLHGLVSERMHRLEATRSEISSTWGGPQTLAGPVLVVPVVRVEEVEGEKGEPREIRSETWASFLPREIDWRAEVEPQVRRRGIFETIVFRAAVRGRASFRPVTPGELDDRIAAVVWEKARLVVGFTDNRGLEAGLGLSVGDRALEIVPGAFGGGGPWARGISASLEPFAEDLGNGEPLPEISLSLALRGSERLHFLPVGETSRVSVAGPWGAPSFSGAFLPRERTVEEDAFRASWVVPWTARSAPQAGLGPPEAFGGELGASAFGTDLLLQADSYQKVDRAAKYGVLFLALTFVAFLLGETGAPRTLHPVHYGLVGAALVLFYVLLLALAEHLGFAPAYAIATLAVAGLVGAYTSALLPRARSLGLTLLLGGLYGYLYVTLAAEDFALLLGAVGLFAALAAVMWTTRRIDWSTLAPTEVSATVETADGIA